jgi:FAD/FMN-containing dehydrogenase
MIEKHPLSIARCADTGDVMTSVRFARENDLLTTVRGGGHNGGGLGSCDNGLVIDLSAMSGVRVDPGSRRFASSIFRWKHRKDCPEFTDKNMGMRENRIEV